MNLFTVLIVIALVTLSALFSGLTLGLMSLNPFSLKRKARLGNRDAQKIYPIRKNGNLLLVTLLLGNVAVNSTLSIFLGSVTTGIIAGLSATALIVTLGEIVPQAFFARHALTLGAKTVWLAYVFVFLFYPVAKPLSWLLDLVLGNELPTVLSKKEVLLFLKDQKKMRTSEIDEDEIAILEGGLGFSEKTVADVMTHAEKIYSLNQHILLNKENLAEIRRMGHSRIPVFGKRRIIGILYSKDLITVDPDDKLPVRKVMRTPVPTIRESTRLDDVLNLFRDTRIHLFVVLSKKRAVTGIITLEDVLEEIVGEIVDEYDIIAKEKRKRKKTRKSPSSRPASRR